MRIGAVARQAKVSVETIRFYERKGLVNQPMRPLGGGYRDYPEEALDRIRFIRCAQGLGFSLREVRLLLSMRADPETECRTVRTQAAAKLAEIDIKIRQLTEIRSALDALIAHCPAEGPAAADCTILEALGTNFGKETM